MSAFDSQGVLIGRLAIPSGQQARHVPRSDDTRAKLLAEGDRLYLSAGRQLSIWNLKTAQYEQGIRFERPVELVRASDDRLIVATPGDRTTLAFAGFNGKLLKTWGEPLVPEAGADHWANEYFAIADSTGARILVFFRFYPVVREYDLEGDLLDERGYALPEPVRRSFEATNPPLATPRLLLLGVFPKDDRLPIRSRTALGFYHFEASVPTPLR